MFCKRLTIPELEEVIWPSGKLLGYSGYKQWKSYSLWDIHLKAFKASWVSLPPRKGAYSDLSCNLSRRLTWQNLPVHCLYWVGLLWILSPTKKKKKKSKSSGRYRRFWIICPNYWPQRIIPLVQREKGRNWHKISSRQWPPPLDHPPEGTLNVRVPETVDDWIQQGIGYSVKNSNSFILIWKLGWT